MVFLSRGWQQIYMVSIRALGHCFGGSASKEGSRSRKLHKQIKPGWEAETLVYSDEDRCLHKRWSGSATSKPCTTGTYWRYSRHTGIHAGYRTHGVRIAVGIVTISAATPRSAESFRFTIGEEWVRPTHELREIQSALSLGTCVLRVHAPAHALGRPRLQRV